ncbi:hypothetical protein GCM10027612_59790 [Microbispora bryophytorum subsp. camponoti]
MTATGRRAAVLGSPIAHSLSPVLHRAAYAAMGLADWRYDAIECAEDGLADLVGGCGPQWAGLSLTMPLKRAVLPLLDTVSDLAVAVGGANTVVFRDGARHGENTDVYGIVQALAEAGVPPPPRRWSWAAAPPRPRPSPPCGRRASRRSRWSCATRSARERLCGSPSTSAPR